MRVYFDNAATTPLAEEVFEAMVPYLKNHYGNPSSIHSAGRKARAAIEQARKTVARYLNASIGEIFFTSGGTESNNMVLKGAVKKLGIQRIISSPLEHPCVIKSLKSIEEDTNVQIDWVTHDHLGRISFDQLEELLQQKTKKTLVSLMHQNNEIGNRLPLDKVAQLCTEHQALFHTDSVQGIGYQQIDLQKTNISFLSGSAHKFHGPKGIGFVYINNNNQIPPFMDGGAQERNMRGGTEHTAGIVGLAKAMTLAYDHLEERLEKIQQLRNYLVEGLKDLGDVKFNGDYLGPCHPKIINVSFPDNVKNNMLVFNLDIAGICASGGSACSSGVESASPVLAAIDPTDTRRSVRFSLSHYNTMEEVDYLLEKLKDHAQA